MCNQKNIVAFVSSTLPVSYFINEKFKNQIIIECDDVIYKSYRALSFNTEEIVIKKIPKQKILKLIYLIVKIHNAKEVIIFHECCWVMLDIIILILKPNIIFKPMVSLDNFTVLSKKENNLYSWIQHYSGGNKISNIYKAIFKKIISLWFDHFKCVSDGGQEYSRISVLKQIHKIKWNISNPYFIKQDYHVDFNFKSNEKIKNNKVLILCGSEPVSNKIQEEIYIKVIDIFNKNNYSVDIKDHPNINNRLEFIFENVNILDPFLPSEIFDLKYSYVLGAFSTSLILVRAVIENISIANLLLLPNHVYEERINHLKALNGFDYINFINNINEIENLIKLNKIN